MFHFSPKFSLLLTTATALSLAAASHVQAQTQANQMQAKVVLASSSTSSQPSDIIRPTASTSANSNWHGAMPNRLISAQIEDGVLTIDGMVAKVQLNYELRRTGYMYFFVPGVGTAVVSLAPMADATKESNAFDGSKLTFEAGGHTFELSSRKELLTRDRSRTDVYVRLDTSMVAMGRTPVMGFGNTGEAPYVWPLSGVAAEDKDAHLVAPPPMPASVLPRTEASASTMTMQ